MELNRRDFMTGVAAACVGSVLPVRAAVPTAPVAIARCKSYGEEFVYSRAQAIELAKATNTVVLSTKSDLPEDVTEEMLAVSEPEVTQLRETLVAATEPTGGEVEIAMAVTAPPSAELEPDTAPTEVAAMMLPVTGSQLPLIALLGLLALGGALAVGLVQKRAL